MEKMVVLGDEAVALGAIHAGLAAAYSYPGTPASEIMEFLIRESKEKRFIATWSVNEKVAYEAALGVSYAGKRALVSMKHVGLNVAADPFINSSLTGANGGLVVVVADDPGMHSSQNEQDSRFYAHFARIFCYEPSSHQEAYEMTRQAFELSEAIGLPVMIRLVTRLAHSRSYLVPREPVKGQARQVGEKSHWTLLPINARRRFEVVLNKQAELKHFSEESPFNRLELSPENSSLGIVAAGIAANYVLENLPEIKPQPSYLKVSTYPLPEKLFRKIIEKVETLLIIEEGYPFIESTLKGIIGLPGKKIKGKLSGDLPLSGELTPDIVRQALGLPLFIREQKKPLPLAARPPQLCPGCPHADTFLALKEALKEFPQAIVFSDIGCYTLGYFPPYSSIDTCVCMGASIGMAKGAADVGQHPSVAVIGDSTFGHSGLTPLLEAARSNSRMTVIILDNGTVAMTGGQKSYASGNFLLKMIEGLGVKREHLRVIEPLPRNLTKNAEIIREEINYPGLSVIVAVRECLQEARKKKRGQE
ncbi:MAG: thiamine pyrophosphate-dependent enzyme [Candidatus Aminicenantes bacterium]|nr:thiamine pyrophosphate-dependent enzyme [Candidatus Aminicenantes bacterium]